MSNSQERSAERAPNTTIKVYPTDKLPYQKLLEIKSFLDSLYGEQHVKFNGQEEPLSWTITLTAGQAPDALNEYLHEELHLTPAEAKRAYVEPEYQSYIAIAADPEDDVKTKATREFLETKVVDRDEIVKLCMPGTNHILAWGNLILNEQAKLEVENHPDVKAPLGVDVVGSLG